MTEELKPLPCPFDEWFDGICPDIPAGDPPGWEVLLREFAESAWSAAIRSVWRDDIEDAPKDGQTRVLVTRVPFNGRDPVHLVSWSRGPNNNAKRWRQYGGVPLSYEPTHWMPLPQPPEEGRG